MAPVGTRLRDHDRRPPTDDSVVGHVRCGQQACTAPGPVGSCPLGAELRVPARGDSDLRREGVGSGTTDASSRESQTVIARLLGRRVAPREGPQIAPRVAWTAGAEAWPQQLRTQVPGPTRGWDSLHATEDRWDAANTGLGSPQPDRTAWGRASRESRLSGHTDAVITALAAAANDPPWTAPQCRQGQTSRPWSERRDASATHGFWSHSIVGWWIWTWSSALTGSTTID